MSSEVVRENNSKGNGFLTLNEYITRILLCIDIADDKNISSKVAPLLNSLLLSKYVIVFI